MKPSSRILLYVVCVCVNIDNGFSYSIHDVNCLDKSTEKYDEGGSCKHMKPKFEILDDNLRNALGCRPDTYKEMACRGRKVSQEELYSLKNLCWECKEAFKGSHKEENMFRLCTGSCFRNSYFSACAQMLKVDGQNLNRLLESVDRMHKRVE